MHCCYDHVEEFLLTDGADLLSLLHRDHDSCVELQPASYANAGFQILKSPQIRELEALRYIYLDGRARRAAHAHAHPAPAIRNTTAYAWAGRPPASLERQCHLICQFHDGAHHR